MRAVEGWKTEPLGRVARLTMGQSPDSRYYSEEEIGLPFLQGCAEFKGRFPKHSLYCSQVKKIATIGSILFSVRAPVGRINIADRDYIIGRGLAGISGIEVDQAYLEHYLTFVELNFRNASQGSTFEAINSSELNGWPIEHPVSKTEQAKIAEILSTVDRAIEQTEALIAKQQRIKTGLMQDLLTRGIDEHGNLRSEQTHKFKDFPLGRIPVEWADRELGAIAFVTKLAGFEFTNYFDYQIGGDIVALRALNIKNERLDLTDIQRIPKAVSDKLPRSKIFADDILITYIGAYIGDILRIEESGKYHLAPNIAKIVAGKSLVPEFLEVFLRSSLVQRQIKSLTAMTATPSLTMTQIRKLLVAVPKDENEQIEIALRIRGLSDALNSVESELNKLRSLKTALMQDLLTGKKRVTTLLELELTH